MTRRHTVLAAAIVAAIGAASDAAAGDPSQWTCSSCPFEKGTSGTVDVGVGATSDDSAKFGDYTGLDRKGAFAVVGGTLRYRDGERYWADVAATDLGLERRSLDARGGSQGLYSLRIGYSEIPRHFADGAATPFLGVGSGVLTLPPGYPGVDTSAMPLATTLQPVAIGYKRSRLEGAATWLGGDAWSYRVVVRHDVRDGTQRLAGSFFSSATHLVAPVDQVTDRLEASASYASRRLQATIGYRVSLFRNGDDSLTWSNPFTPVVAGASTGQLALAPDNQFHQLVAAAGYEIAPRLRASGEIAFGRMLQNEAYLAPTLTPSLAASLPALPTQSLQGRADTFDASARLSAEPIQGLHVNAIYARNVRDNRTPQESYPAVSTDMFLGADPRINQPFSFTQDRFKVDLDSRVPFGMKASAGVELDYRERTLQEVLRTREATFWGRLVARPADAVSLALKLAHGDRVHSTYGVATWISPPENPLLRKFYLADRDRDSVDLRADFTIGEAVNLGLGFDLANDRYGNSPVGLLDDRSTGFGADLSLPIDEQTQLHAFAQSERVRSSQAGSQAFALADWSGRTTDHFDVFGLGVKRLLLKGKLELAADLALSRARSQVTVETGAADPPFPNATTAIDDLRLKGTYRLNDKLSLIGMYWYQRYAGRDWRFDGILPGTVPNLLALGEQPPNYHINVVQIALRYRY